MKFNTLDDAKKFVAELDADSMHNLQYEINQRIAEEQRSLELLPEEIQELRAGNKLSAVKSVRSRLKLGLVEAVVFVKSKGW